MTDPLLTDVLGDAGLGHLQPHLLGETLGSLAERIEDDRECRDAPAASTALLR